MSLPNTYQPRDSFDRRGDFLVLDLVADKFLAFAEKGTL